MITTAYFDTNIFDHIHKRIGVTDSDLSALRSIVNGGKISILLSVLNLEETLAAVESDPNLAVAELQLILALADRRKFIKDTKLLLRDDIICYARGENLSSPFITDPVLQSNLERLMNATQSDTAKLWADVKEKTQKQKEGFKDGMREAQEKILPCLKQLKGKSLNFSEYWKIGAEKLTEAFADHVGVLEACRKRGIKSMLDIRSVRLCVGGSLSLIYAHDFEGRTPKIDDSRDLQHAVLSAASDAFVTHDGKFTRLAARIPIDNFEVMDLRGLLQQLG